VSTVLDENLGRILKSALAVEAPPLRAEQMQQILQQAAARRRPADPLPVWVIAALAAGLVAFTLVAWSLPRPLAALKIAAGIALLANLGLSPLAAVVIVRNRRWSYAH
jgi:CHASE2 domain-containing sensor protein